jgi:hypothetical protein
VLQSAVNNSLEFASVFDFPSLGQYYPSPVGVEPGRIAESLIGPTGLLYFHQKCLDYVFLHASALPENTLGVNVNVEVTWLDDSDGAGFLLGFAFGRLTVRKARFGGAFRERPFATAVGVDEQKLRVRVTASVTNGGYL